MPARVILSLKTRCELYNVRAHTSLAAHRINGAQRSIASRARRHAPVPRRRHSAHSVRRPVPR
jgi:hypothetical protein